MTYTLTIELGNGSFSVSHDNLGDLSAEMERMGFETNLVSMIRENVGKVGKAVQIQVVPESAPQPTADAAEPSDPWGSGAPTTQTALPSKTDPWADEDPTPGAAPVTQSSQNGATVSPTKTRDNLGREWTFDLPDAPMCACGIKAAKMKGTSQKTNKAYTVWKCPKAAGENWRDKCEFSQFPN